MQVVVVMREHPDDAQRPYESGVRADEDDLGSGRHEAVDQILGQPQVGLACPERGALTSVPARVVDVHVEAVLMRNVAGPPEPWAEVSTVGAAQIADADAWRTQVIRGVLLDHP